MNAAAVQDPPDFEGVALAAGAQEIEVQAGFRLEIMKENGFVGLKMRKCPPGTCSANVLNANY